ncbi:hypothetical protein [Armatimonas sp.]|uniref:hypothetical protein n=1 Tax=Armatimonas sp. TaxID=1872638 RepID=UPI0037516CEB
MRPDTNTTQFLSYLARQREALHQREIEQHLAQPDPEDEAAANEYLATHAPEAPALALFVAPTITDTAPAAVPSSPFAKPEGVGRSEARTEAGGRQNTPKQSKHEIEDTAYHLAAIRDVPEAHRGLQIERLARKIASWSPEARERFVIKTGELLVGHSRETREIVLGVLMEALPGKLPASSPPTETILLAGQANLLMPRLISIAKHDAKWKRDILAAGLRDELMRKDLLSQAASIIAQGAAYLDDLDLDTRLRVGQICRVLFGRN